MSFSSSTIILFLSALFSTASPLGSRDPTPGCHPNFGGVALTLSTPSGALSWSAKPVLNDPLSASSSSSSKFFFQQNGFPIVDYTVKTVENNNFAVQLGAGGAPLMANTDPSGSNPNQKWMVDCTECTSKDISQTKGKVASGCSITSTTNKLCVTSKTTPATLASCDNSADQLFDITAVTV